MNGTKNLDTLESTSENTWNILKCGAGEGWRSNGPFVSEIKYYKTARKT